jgi:hypothetical protein
MNWEMIAAIGQITAALVGIPSIIYLAIQIRSQTRERREAAANALTAQWGDLTKSLHDTEEFAALFLRGLQSFDELDAVSKLRFSAFFNRFFNNFKAMYFSYRENILTEMLWKDLEQTMSDFLAYPGTQQWWKTRKHWHAGEFGRLVDATIARGEKPTAYSTYDLRQVTERQVGGEGA